MTAYELAKLIESVLDGSDGSDGKDVVFHLSADSIEMLEIQDNFTRPIEQFGLVRIASLDRAQKVVKELDGFIINQNQITVREYFIRSTKNDPRLKKMDSAEALLEKRENERRLKGRLLQVREKKDRRAEDRRTEARRLEERNEQDRRFKERRIMDRRQHYLIHSRRV